MSAFQVIAFAAFHPRRLHLPLAAILVAARGVVLAQDVRLNTVTNSYGSAIVSVATDDTRFRATWDINFEFCPSQTHIVERAIDLGGHFLGGEVLAQASCTPHAQYSAVAMLPTGEFLVARHLGAPPDDVYGVCFDASGAIVTPDVKLNQVSSTSGYELHAIAQPAGYYIVVWTAETPQMSPYGRVIYPDGATPLPEVLLPSNATGNEFGGTVAVFGSGEVTACWAERSTVPPYPFDIIERRFDPMLTPLTADTIISQTPALGGPVTLGVAAEGSYYVVAWTKGLADSDVVARRFDQFAGPLGNEFLVNTYTTSTQGLPFCAIDAQGRLLITWESYGEDGASLGGYAQRFDSQGASIGSEFRINMTTYNPQGDPRVAMLSSGDFLAVFDSRTGSYLEGIPLARRFFFPVSLAIAPGPSGGNQAQALPSRPDGSAGPQGILPYSGAYGAFVGAGDLDAAAPDELLTGPGPSPVYGPHVRAFRPDGTTLQKVSFYAYGTLRYGVKPQGANLDGDAAAEILSTPGQGAVFGPHVRGWNYDGATLTAISKVSFFAYGTLKYGANSSHGNVDGDSYDEILTGPGPGIMFAPQLRGFNYDGASVTAIAKINANAFPTTSYGATISAADIESDGVGGYGDGYEELLAGQGPGPSFDSQLRIFDYDNASLAQKFAVTPYTTLYGLHTAGGDVDAGDTEEVVTAPGPDPAATAHILCWEWNPALGSNTVADLQTIGTDDFVAFPGELYGANVAVGTFE